MINVGDKVKFVAKYSADYGHATVIKQSSIPSMWHVQPIFGYTNYLPKHLALSIDNIERLLYF